MHNELERFKRSCLTLSQHRRLCTGEELHIPAPDAWPAHVRSEGDLERLVSAAYKLWREKWKLDIGFLLGDRRTGGAAWDFDNLIYHLRTARQHTDNAQATARWAAWTRDSAGGHEPAGEDDWAACGQALMASLNNAIEALYKLAAAGRSSEPFRRGWHAKVSESVQAVVARVAADLGLHLHPKRRDHYVREVERLWSRHRLRPGELAVDVLASFAERVLVSEVKTLPCDYQLILEELDVLATADAVAALRLAHSVAEVSGAHGEAFLKLVGSTWVTLRLDDASS
ncbi:hypothetical protein AB6O49_30225 [Streptomyces sp. SBR177]